MIAAEERRSEPGASPAGCCDMRVASCGRHARSTSDGGHYHEPRIVWVVKPILKMCMADHGLRVYLRALTYGHCPSLLLGVLYGHLSAVASQRSKPSLGYMLSRRYSGPICRQIFIFAGTRQEREGWTYVFVFNEFQLFIAVSGRFSMDLCRVTSSLVVEETRM